VTAGCGGDEMLWQEDPRDALSALRGQDSDRHTPGRLSSHRRRSSSNCTSNVIDEKKRN